MKLRTVLALLALPAALLTGCATQSSAGPSRLEIRLALEDREQGFLPMTAPNTHPPKKIYLSPAAELTGADIKSAEALKVLAESMPGMSFTVGPPGQGPGSKASEVRTPEQPTTTVPAVGIIFTRTGAWKIDRFTKNNIGRRLALMMDGRLVLVAPIKGRVSEGRMVIMSEFDEAGTRKFADEINQRAGR